MDRDDVEDALESIDALEVVGAGGGDLGGNIDLEVVSPISRDEAMRMVADVLQQLDLAAISYLRPSDTGERINIVDLLQ
ncbi:hypothetical protein [Polymorphospora rubra]|uniref:hypothetical protein n=1 Tax=Polymorphospora rubra TaxID=338584 RepID=UPI0033D31491